MPDSSTFEFENVTADKLFDACLRAVARLGYTIQHSDRDVRTVSFNTGFSMRSSAGQDMTVTVFSSGDQRAEVIVGGKRAQRGNIFGGGGQLFDWGEKGKITNKFIEALDTVIGAQA